MSDTVDFKQLKNLIAISEAGTITLAAKRLFLSQPALSAQMKELEEALHVPLLVRDSKGSHVTPAAEMLIAGSRELLHLRDSLVAAVRGLHPVKFLPMRLGFSSFVDHSLFEMVCSIHASLFPACEIKPASGDTVELLLMLEKGEIDAALLTLPVKGLGFNAFPFAQSRLVVCMKADDPLARLKEIAPSELQSKLTIFREPSQHPEAHERLMEMLDKAGIQGDVSNTAKTPRDIQFLIESGFGCALVREGSEMPIGLVTRPITGVTWTVESALILGNLPSHKTSSHLLRELRKRFRLQGLLPPCKPVRSVRPALAAKSLPLFA